MMWAYKFPYERFKSDAQQTNNMGGTKIMQKLKGYTILEVCFLTSNINKFAAIFEEQLPIKWHQSKC